MPQVGELVRRTVQPFVSSHRILLYTLFSLFAVSGTIVNALRSHSNFYSVAIYLSKSSRSVLVLANCGVLLALLCGRIMQKIFFGPLLPAEVERLYDRIWFFVTESLLAFTIFRDEFDVPFAVMFGFLLFVKCFHWLLADRIEWMDQRPYPGPPPLFHIRALSLFALLTIVDVVMFGFAIESTLNYGVGAIVLFANEYAILMATAWNSMAKYALSIYDLRRASTRGGANAPPWEAKSMWIFYVELVTDFFKLATYLVFFIVIITFYGLPLNIVRDVYMTAHSFVTRLRAFYRYRTATRDMDQRYPNATALELGDMSDRTCIICREEMTPAGAPAVEGGVTDGNTGQAQALPPPQPQDGPNMTPKKLPCGHIFHFHCLRAWLERQQNCPTCRRTVLETNTGANAGVAGAQPNQPAGDAANGIAPPPRNLPQGPARPWGLFAQDQHQAVAAAAAANPPAPPPAQPNLFARLLGAVVPPPPAGPDPFAPRPLGQLAPPAPAPGAAPAPGLVQAQAHGVLQAGVPVAPGAVAQEHMQGQLPPALVFSYNYLDGGDARLQQPPILQGFYREDGLWQGWPTLRQPIPQASRARTRQGTPAPVESTPNATQPPSSTPSSAVDTGAGATSSPAQGQDPPPRDSDQTSAKSSPTGPAGVVPTPVGRPATPRDAAALAALRRNNPDSSQGIVSPPGPTSLSRSSTAVDTPGEGLAPATTSELLAPTPTPAPTPASASTSTSSPLPTSAPTPTPTFPAATSVTAPSTSGNPQASNPMASSPTSGPGAPKPALPAVIPLYDYGRPPTARVAQVSSAQQAHFRHQHQGQSPISPSTGHMYNGARPTPYPYPPRVSSSPTTGSGAGYPYNTSTAAHTLSARTPGAGSAYASGLPFAMASAVPLSRLPTRVTEEDLKRMEGTTRAAIDERLRVLAEVDGAVWRCIEDLLRMRSVLPTVARPTSSGRGQPAPSPARGESRSGSTKDKGKGKAVDPAERKAGSSATSQGPDMTSAPSTPLDQAPPSTQVDETAATPAALPLPDALPLNIPLPGLDPARADEAAASLAAFAALVAARPADAAPEVATAEPETVGAGLDGAHLLVEPEPMPVLPGVPLVPGVVEVEEVEVDDAEGDVERMPDAEKII